MSVVRREECDLLKCPIDAACVGLRIDSATYLQITQASMQCMTCNTSIHAMYDL